MIVILDNDRDSLFNLRKRLYMHRTPSAILSVDEIERIGYYPVHGILIHHPETVESIEELCNKIREAYPRIPLLLTYRDGAPINYFVYRRMVDEVLEERTTTATLLRRVYEHYEEKNGSIPDSFTVEGVRVIMNDPFVHILMQAFPTRRVDYMILRYLSLTAPRPVPAEELLETAFPPSTRKRGPHTVAKIIAGYNGFVARGFEGMQIIAFKRGHGYYIHRHQKQK